MQNPDPCGAGVGRSQREEVPAPPDRRSEVELEAEARAAERTTQALDIGDAAGALVDGHRVGATAPVGHHLHADAAAVDEANIVPAHALQATAHFVVGEAIALHAAAVVETIREVVATALDTELEVEPDKYLGHVLICFDQIEFGSQKLYRY